MEISTARTLAYEALDHRAMRQDLIASNISNVDTPFYRPKDIAFEQMLAQKKAKLMDGDSSGELKLASTNATHLQPDEEIDSSKPTVFYRDGHMARNDGNSVDLDTETTELSKNGVMYNGLLAALKKDKMIFMNVIESSAKI